MPADTQQATVEQLVHRRPLRITLWSVAIALAAILFAALLALGIFPNQDGTIRDQDCFHDLRSV